jgi:hypothetical protein
MAEPKRPSLCRSEAAQRRCSRVQSGGICRPATRSVLCQGPPFSLQSSDPSFQYAMGPNRAPSESHTICLPVLAHVSFPTCHPVFSPAEFRVRSAGCSTEAPMMHLSCKLSSAIATRAEIGPSRHKSAQIKAYIAYYRLRGARELTEILPRHVIPRHSQAHASHVVVRHFFDWPSHIAWKQCQGKASVVAITEEHCREGCDGATARRGS